jgi:hypothetical protein
MGQMIADSLWRAWLNFLDGLILVVPRVLAMLSIVVAGWLIALILGFVTRHVLGWLKFNGLLERTGTAQLLKKTGLPPAETVAGSMVFWIVWLGFLIAGVGALGFAGTDAVVQEFLLFVPRFVVALIIIAAGLVAANFVWRATLLAAVNAQLPSARLLANAVRFLIVILAVAMALEQIAVAKTVVLTAFAIAFGAVMLGLAIAFGIGGGNVARRILEQQFPEREQRESDRISHL